MTSQRQILANKRNAAKSRGPRTQEGKARSRMNALRHGLAAATVSSTILGDACVSPLDEMSERLRQIETERTRILTKMGDMSGQIDVGNFPIHLQQLVALERYAQRAHAKLKRDFLKGC